MTKEAFQDFFEENFSPVRNYLYFRTRDLSKSEDLAQEAFVRLWQKKDRIIADTARAYLFKTAINLMMKTIGPRS